MVWIRSVKKRSDETMMTRMSSADQHVDQDQDEDQSRQQQRDRMHLTRRRRRTRPRTAEQPAITIRAFGQVLSSQWDGSSQCA